MTDLTGYSDLFILNGDALVSRLGGFKADHIVMRECLIEGNVSGDDIQGFYSNRAAFFSERYGVTEEEYRLRVSTELDRLDTALEYTSVNLWFEFDLFCQVNMWYTCHRLVNARYQGQAYFVSPTHDEWSGFGGLSDEKLNTCYQKKQLLSPNIMKLLAHMWRAFQRSDWQTMQHLASLLENPIPGIGSVVQAHIDRFQEENGLGRPQVVLLRIASQMENPEFGEIFKAFNQTEGIYGFGDTQVKKMCQDLSII